MAHGGTNFGFYNGANAGQESDYNADLTSYDYVRNLIICFTRLCKLQTISHFPFLTNGNNFFL